MINASPGRRNVKRSDLRALIRGADRQAVGAEAAVIDHQPVPGRRVLGVVRIRRLEPGPREAEIEVDRVRCRKA